MQHVEGNTQWDGLPMPRRIWAVLAVAFGVSVSVLDGSIANVALPTLMQELHVGHADSIWIINAYQLAIAVLILSFSTLGDTWGYKRVYVLGLCVFTVSSLCCAFSRSFSMLVASRVLQGIGAAALTSINTTIVRMIFPRGKLGRGMGLNATVVAVSSVLGPSLAAGILSVGNWPWLFLVNVPIGLSALYFSLRFLPPNPVRITERHFNWKDGAVNGFVFGLLIASIEARSHELPVWISLSGVLVSAFTGVWFVKDQLRKPFPILPFDLLRKPIFAMSMLTAVCSYIAQMAALVALPFYFHEKMGLGPVDTGLLMTAWPAIIMVVAPAAGFLVERIHAGWMGGIGLAVMGAGLVLLSHLPQDPSRMLIVSGLLVCGFGFALFQSPNNSILIASAPPQQSGSASGMLATARIFGQAAGSALVALFFNLYGIEACRYSLYMAAAFALLASVASLCRVNLPLPESLRPRK